MAWPGSSSYTVFWLGAQDIIHPHFHGLLHAEQKLPPHTWHPMDTWHLWVRGISYKVNLQAPTASMGSPQYLALCTATIECHWRLGESQGWGSACLLGEPACLLLTDHICRDFMLLPSTYMKQHSNIEFSIELTLRLP